MTFVAGNRLLCVVTGVGLRLCSSRVGPPDRRFSFLHERGATLRLEVIRADEQGWNIHRSVSAKIGFRDGQLPTKDERFPAVPSRGNIRLQIPRGSNACPPAAVLARKPGFPARRLAHDSPATDRVPYSGVFPGATPRELDRRIHDSHAGTAAVSPKSGHARAAAREHLMARGMSPIGETCRRRSRSRCFRSGKGAGVAEKMDAPRGLAGRGLFELPVAEASFRCRRNRRFVRVAGVHTN